MTERSAQECRAWRRWINVIVGEPNCGKTTMATKMAQLSGHANFIGMSRGSDLSRCLRYQDLTEVIDDFQSFWAVANDYDRLLFVERLSTHQAEVWITTTCGSVTANWPKELQERIRLIEITDCGKGLNFYRPEATYGRQNNHAH